MKPTLPKVRRAGRLTPASRDEIRRVAPKVYVAGATALVLGLALTFGFGLAVSADVGCGACHEMRPYVEAHAESTHAGIECSDCHARAGAVGMMADGFRAAGWFVGTFGTTTPTVSWSPDAPCAECHAETLAGTVRGGRGVRVRHADFEGEPCSTCHSGRAHELEGRHYVAPLMEDCMSCHRAVATELESCATCHPTDAATERSPGWSAWRAAHGRGWQKAHGMADLDECRTCHPPQYCVGCHGATMPHPGDWPKAHGASAINTGADSCEECHERSWCTSCHGVEMPHASSFLKRHGEIAEGPDDVTCTSCHSPDACDACHLASSHPNVPAVGMGMTEVP